MILLGNDYADQCMDELERMEEAARVDEEGVKHMREDLLLDVGELTILAVKTLGDLDDDIPSIYTNPTKFCTLLNEALDDKAEKDYEAKYK